MPSGKQKKRQAAAGAGEASGGAVVADAASAVHVRMLQRLPLTCPFNLATHNCV